jgi:hypothetical protein
VFVNWRFRAAQRHGALLVFEWTSVCRWLTWFAIQTGLICPPERIDLAASATAERQVEVINWWRIAAGW